MARDYNGPDHQIKSQLTRIAEALERLAPAPRAEADLDASEAYLWDAERESFKAIETVARLDLSLLIGIDRVRDILLENTRRFAAGLPANNALLWGARGMGKSSLVKAVHGQVAKERPKTLALIEIHREDIATLPVAMRRLSGRRRRFLLFTDDLSFDHADTSYKSLKTVLDGGIEGRPDNILFYATSNRRHLMPREMVENERSTAINPSEAVEEKVSLSDRFGLWLGFHNCSQDDYLAMIQGYVAALKLDIAEEDWRGEAIEWAATRGARSGRVAWQYICDLAGRLGRRLDFS